MENDQKVIGCAGTLRVFPTNRFKTGMLSVLTVLPPDPVRTPLERLLFSVLCRGTEKYPTVASLNRRMDELYASGLSVRSTRYGNYQLFGFRADFLEERYIPDGCDVTDGMLEIVEQLLFHPLLENGRFSEAYLASEKKIQCDAIRASQSNPQAYAVRRCQEMLYGDDPFVVSQLGTEELVKGFTGDDLLAESVRLFGSAERPGVPFQFVYVGSMSPDAMAHRLENRFGSYTAGERVSVGTPVPQFGGTLRSATEEMPVAQSRLVIAIPTGVTLNSPEFYAMLVLNEMLGVSPASKLFLEVREKKSLCYHCASSYDFYKGVIYITAGIRRENREAATEGIFLQLKALRRGDFTEDELQVAKKSLANSYRQIPDNPGAIEGYAFGRALYGVRTTVEETMAHFGNVTREDLIAAAGRLNPEVLFFLDGTGKGGEEDDDEN